jgi:spore coat protein U-like protein
VRQYKVWTTAGYMIVWANSARQAEVQATAQGLRVRGVFPA